MEKPFKGFIMYTIQNFVLILVNRNANKFGRKKRDSIFTLTIDYFSRGCMIAMLNLSRIRK